MTKIKKKNKNIVDDISYINVADFIEIKDKISNKILIKKSGAVKRKII